METTQPVTQQAIARAESYPTLVAELSPTQFGWLKLESVKRTTFGDLQNQELAVQALLVNITEDKVLESVQKKLTEAKNIASTAKEQRLEFTNLVTKKIIDPAMEFEKRNAVLIANGMTHELGLRKAAAEQSDKKATYDRELASLKAHITNEYFRIATAYRQKLKSFITDAYTTALRGKTPVDQLPAYLETVRGFMAAEQLPKFVKFERTVVTDDDAKTAFNSIKKFVPQEALEEAFKDLENQFALYEQELANAEVAIQQAEQEQAAQVSEQNSKLELETATNVLIAQAEVTVAAGPTVKKTFAPVEENTQAFAMAVISHFIKNFQIAAPKLKVKTWSKLSIGQMADALAKLVTEKGMKFEGLQFKEVEK